MENEIDAVAYGIPKHRAFLLCLSNFNELLHVPYVNRLATGNDQQPQAVVASGTAKTVEFLMKIVL